MANILIPRSPAERWSQPQGPSEIDWSNPIARELRSAIVDSGALKANAVTKANLSRSAPAYVQSKPVKNYYSAEYTFGAYDSGPIGLSGLTEFTAIALYVKTNDVGDTPYGGPFGASLTGETTRSFEVEPGGPSSTYFSVWGDNGARYNLLADGALNPLNVPRTIAMRLSASVLSGYFDGAKSGAAAGPATLQTVHNIHVGANPNGWGGVVPVFYFWTRALSDAEIASISANPWQLFKSSQPKFILDLGANSANAKKPATTRQSFLLGTSQPGPKPSVAPLILRDWKRHEQPQGPVEIDWSNPIADPAGIIWTADNGFVNAPTSRSNMVQAVAPSGVGVTRSAATNYIEFPDVVKKANDFTIALQFVASNVTTTQALFARSYEGGAYPQNWVVTVGSGKINFGSSADGYAYISSGSIVAGRVYTVVATVTPGKFWSLFVNGARVATRQNTGDPTTENAGFRTRIGTVNGDSFYGLQAGTIVTTAIAANRCVPDAVASSISANPWQLFKPRQQRIWVGV